MSTKTYHFNSLKNANIPYNPNKCQVLYNFDTLSGTKDTVENEVENFHFNVTNKEIGKEMFNWFFSLKAFN